MSDVFAVIMAGGAGTRFWPASRSHRPKQLLPLAGGDEPLLRATVRRLAPLVTPDRVFVVTGEHLADATRAAVPDVPANQILCEPAARNTAPCIAWANATIARRSPEATVMVLPSDHHVIDEPAFRSVLQTATTTAKEGRVTTVGIVPTRPETGYGYIELGAAIPGAAPGVRAVARFVEKPDRARAEDFVAGGRHLWNAGMFFFRVRDMAELVARHLPAMAEGVARIDAAAREGHEDEAVKSIFPTLQSISIDHGVMEKAEGLAVVPGEFGWNDLGSWQSSWELASQDEQGNALAPGAIAVDASGNLVRQMGASKKVVALVGVKDLVVVETDDALLVMPRERAQDVRLVVEALKASGRSSLV